MNSPLPSWIERIFRIETAPGEGTAWSLQESWGWPPWVTLLVVLFSVVFVVFNYLKDGPQSSKVFRMLLAAIRLLLVAIVLFMLGQFTLSLHRTGLPYVAVIFDDSLSMNIVDKYDERTREKLSRRVAKAGIADDELSRWNLARMLLTENNGKLLSGIQQDYRLRIYSTSGVRPEGTLEVDQLVERINSIEPAGEATRLGAAVRTVLDDLRGSWPAAIVLVTDGINTDGPALADLVDYARSKDVRLFAVGIGDDQPVRDLKLTDLLVEEVVFVDDVVLFEVKLTATGFQRSRAKVVLRRADSPNVLAETTVEVLPNGQPQQLRLQHSPTAEGEFRYVVEVEAQPGELDSDNNRQERTVSVRKQQIRVLLVQAYPSYEFRYLANMLNRDSTIELNTVLQSADLEHAEQDSTALKGFPVRPDELFAYDVIILGDVDPGLLSNSMIENLVDFVDQPQRGGGLVFISGPRYMPLAYRDSPLARLMPINLDTARYPDPQQSASGFVVIPTELGLVSAPQMQLGDTPAETLEIWHNLPPLYWMLEAPEVKPTARVLAEHPTLLGNQGRPLPVALMQYVGAGKVLFHATDETWRWRHRVGDVFFARYWVQTIRYLSRSALSDDSRGATLTADRREYRRGESVRLRLRFGDERLAPVADDGVTVVIEHKGHQTQRVKLHRSSVSRGVFEGLLTAPAIGSYHAWVAIPAQEGRAPAADFSVEAPPGEFERVQMNAAELRRAADATRGRFYTLDSADRLLGDLPQGRQVPVESLPPMPLWNTWPLLLVFLVLLVTEWILRKVGAMV